MQLSIGLPSPREQSALPILKRVQAGISRTGANQGRQAKVRILITIQLLSRIRTALDDRAHREKVVL